MDCEVVVVGGGIGGLTVAALLAQRGKNVCLLERQAEVGAVRLGGFRHDQRYRIAAGMEDGERDERYPDADDDEAEEAPDQER